MKLTRDLVLIAVVCLGFYGWRHRLIPKPKPLFKGPAPSLTMPAPSSAPPRPDAGGAMLVEKESRGGRNVRPAPLGKAATPKGMAAVFALFVLCYLVLGRALRKGPGGRGFTHD